MISQRIGQSIDVLASFKDERAEPMTFKWGARCYRVSKVDLIHTEYRAGVKIFYFFVSGDQLSWRLSFNSETLAWRLEDVCEPAT